MQTDITEDDIKMDLKGKNWVVSTGFILFRKGTSCETGPLMGLCVSQNVRNVLTN